MFVTKKEFNELKECYAKIKKACIKKVSGGIFLLDYEIPANDRIDRLTEKIEAIYKYFKLEEKNVAEQPAKTILVKIKEKK